MVNFKHLKSLCLLSLMLVSVPLSAQIQGPEGDVPASIAQKTPSVDEQISDLMANPNFSLQQKQQVLNKLKRINTYNFPDDYLSETTLNVPAYKQETSYWCGPATTKQTMQFLTGSSNSQSSIASSLGTTSSGTDGTKIVKYLNNNQSHYYYTIYELNQDDIDTEYAQQMIDLALFQNAPVILRVNTKGISGWPYSSSGHFLNLSGQTQYATKYQVTDPWIKWVDSSSTGTYWLNSTAVFDATLNHFAQHIYL